MKTSYNWLKEFVNFKEKPEELAHILTMAGLEVEFTEKVGDDIIYDIGVTPNRPDWLSMRGVAREISAILDLPMKDVSASVTNEKGEGPLVEIDDPTLCPRYSARIIKGVKLGPSPEWLTTKLESCGIRPASNIVDITNYVLLEIGQPMHAFDLDKLAGGKILVKQAGDINKFRTLDDEERKISKETLLIWDAEKPVAIAGVMGGGNTEVSDSTVNILLESAYFQPSSVRRTSRTLGLSSESAYRFERGVDKEAVILALDRAAELIVELAGGEVSKSTDEYPKPFEAREIIVPFKRINSLIGIDIKEDFIINTLQSLGFVLERRGELLSITPPSYREDAERDIDIVEEVARIYGYDKMPSTLPEMHMSHPPEHKLQELVKKLKISMVKSGFSEAINYSFLNPEIVDQLNLAQDDRRRDLIYVRNPLRKEESAMRTTIIPALLNNVNTNIKRGEKTLRFFEISKVFLSSGKKLADEVTQLGAVFLKDNSTSLWQTKHDGFYDIKGVFENIFKDLKICATFSTDQAEPYMHPAKSCAIMIGDEKIGSIGTLHPAVADTFDIKGDITIAEIDDLERLLDAASSKVCFSSLPKFPSVERDIALVVSDDVTVSSVEKEIREIGSEILDNVTLFDIYKGKPIAKDKKSLAFSIRYRSSEKTLTDSEVDKVHAVILKRLEENLKAELRS
ncbi:MAG: phenylalanine--tRNA ligase subunit beta [Nitrospira sp.]|nr:phenylalanine--tRNA ligase subunit beta [Nitrospira sp.]